MTKSVVLCILDGWGHRENGSDNAIFRAKTPFWDQLLAHCPHTLLEASESHVGLPEGQMGNSEVGHMNIGAGRIILQDLPQIDDAIKYHTLEKTKAFINFINTLRQTGGTCHLLGLLSPGGIHSHERHIKTLATLLSDQGIPVAIHAFLDGRDTPPKSAKTYLTSLLQFIENRPNISLATIGGRYYGMDRDKRWDRIQKAYESIVIGTPQTKDILAYLQESYEKGITDEFVHPIALRSYAGMQDGDGLLMANFRADRTRQILVALLDPNFNSFKRTDVPHFAAALGLTEYSETLNQWMKTVFPPSLPQDILGEIISREGLKQLRIAETEKYAHVTFFFNGGRENVFPGEDRILIPSPSVATYDLQPEMSAFELTDYLEESIKSQKYTLIIANYANTDMVGHTGNLVATQQAVETVDTCLGRVKAAVKTTGTCLLITADHGNAEKMYDQKHKSPHTAHTLNPVPFVMCNGPQKKLHPGNLSDIAPTILEILNLVQPSAMTGNSLLESTHD